MDDHSISWASLLYVAITAGALGYILGAASALAVGGAVRRERIAMAARAGVGADLHARRSSRSPIWAVRVPA